MARKIYLPPRGQGEGGNQKKKQKYGEHMGAVIIFFLNERNDMLQREESGTVPKLFF